MKCGKVTTRDRTLVEHHGRAEARGCDKNVIVSGRYTLKTVCFARADSPKKKKETKNNEETAPHTPSEHGNSTHPPKATFRAGLLRVVRSPQAPAAQQAQRMEPGGTAGPRRVGTGGARRERTATNTPRLRKSVGGGQRDNFLVFFVCLAFCLDYFFISICNSATKNCRFRSKGEVKRR